MKKSGQQRVLPAHPDIVSGTGYRSHSNLSG
jgi:hypothetical protein